MLERSGATDIVREIEHAQLRWYRHLLRMDSSSEVKKSYTSRLEGKWAPGCTDEALVATKLWRRMEACGLEKKDAAEERSGGKI